MSAASEMTSEASTQPKSGKKSPEPDQPTTKYVVASLLIVVLGVVIAVLTVAFGWSSVTRSTVEGVTVFAILFVLAQAIERVVELVLPWLDRLILRIAKWDVPVENRKAHTLSARKAKAIQEVRKATNAGIPNAALRIASFGGTGVDSVKEQAVETSQAEKKTKEVRNETALLTQSLSFAIALVLVVWFKFSLTGEVGFENVPNWLDFLLTAAAIMGGSAGLHDLVSKIQKQKENEEAKAS